MKREAERMPPQPPILPRALPQAYDLPCLSSLSPEAPAPSINTVYRLSMFSELQHKGLLWRSIFARVWEHLSTIVHGTRLLVDGPRGVGKSAMLLIFRELLAVRYPKARILYLPRMSKWTAGYYSYLPVRQEPRASSEPSDRIFVQPDLAWDILHWNLNTLLLPSPNGNTLPEDRQLAPDLLQRTLLELAVESTALATPLVIIADEVNALFAPTGYRDAQGKPLTVEDLTVPRLIKTIIHNSQVILLAATCRSNPTLVQSTLEKAADLNASPISLPYFGVEETMALLRYYEALGHLPRQGGIDLQYAQRMNFVTGGCPQHLLAYSAYEAIYRRR